eukprot:195124_1
MPTIFESKTKGYLCAIGGILLHLTFGTFYTFGNMSPYLASYIASTHGGMDDYPEYRSQCVWIYTIMGMAQAVALPIGGKVELILGPTKTTLIGCFIMSLGVFLTYFACSNLYYAVITYGALKGFGLGFAYSTPLVVGMRWFPKHKGRVTGCIIMGFGAASTIFDLIQTELINPDNIDQDAKYGFTKYPNVLDNVPTCFIKLGAMYIAMQLIGCMLLSNPNDFIYPHRFGKSISKEEEFEDALLGEDRKELDELNINECDRDRTTDVVVKDMEAMDVLKSATFWNLWVTFCLNGLCLTFVSTQYKNFSDDQLGISNDRFLAIMGAISSVFNGLGRLFWSSWLDRNRSYRLTMGLMTSICTVTLATWPLIGCLKDVNVVLMDICAIVWLCVLFFSICGSFSVFPTQVTNVYGSNNNGVIYGLLFTALLPSTLVAAFGIIYIEKYFNWNVTAWTFAACGAISFFLTMRSKTDRANS